MDRQVIISVKTILITFLIGLGVYVLYKLGPIIGIMVVALMLSLSLEPLIKYFMRQTLFNKPLSRSFSVILVYSLFITVSILVLTVGLPPVFLQVQKLVASLDVVLKDLNIDGQIALNLSQLLPDARGVTSSVVTFTLDLFSNFATLVTMIIISIYLSLDWENIRERFLDLMPDSVSEEVAEVLQEIEQNVGNWVKGQLALMVIVGMMSFIGLLILDVSYPLALGLLSGVLEIVPMIGPVIAAVIAGVIGFSDAPIKGLGVVLLFVIIQQFENNLLVPKIMQKISGFSPIIILLALLIGNKFFGVTGAILAVPMTMIIAVIVKHVLKKTV